MEFVEDTPDRETKEKLIETLQTVTEGKVKRAHAVLTANPCTLIVLLTMTFVGHCQARITSTVRVQQREGDVERERGAEIFWTANAAF